MAQVSLYIDDSLQKRLEKQARRENKSLSAWVREKLEESLARSWSESFLATNGALADLAGFERPPQADAALDLPRERFDE